MFSFGVSGIDPTRSCDPLGCTHQSCDRPSRATVVAPIRGLVEAERRILIVDTPGGELQQLAMELLGRDFEVHYAADLDEAQLLAAETDGKINAVLFTADAGIERVPDLAARFGVAPDTLIPFGVRPAPRVVKALHHHGVRWHLWDDAADEAIRFVISVVLHDHDPFELRYHVRVPTRIEARYASDGGGKADVTIQDIGLGGACLVGDGFAGDDARGELSLAVDGREITLPTRTVWCVEGAEAASGVGGVAFLEVDPDAGDAIDSLRRAFLERHRIDPAG